MNKKTLETYRRSKDMIKLNNDIVTSLAELSEKTNIEIDIIGSNFGKNCQIYINEVSPKLKNSKLYFLGSLLIRFAYNNKTIGLVCYLTDKEFEFNLDSNVKNHIIKTDPKTHTSEYMGELYNSTISAIQELKKIGIDIYYGIFSSSEVSVRNEDIKKLLDSGFMYGSSYGSSDKILKGLKAFLGKAFYINWN